MSFGTVTGFGSVVLDGTSYNSASPQYFAGSDQDATAQTASTSVELGDQLQIQLDAQGLPSMVVIEPELMGPVANLTASGFSVNGVAVQVNTNPAAGPVTYYAGLADYSSLTTGMQVEVHGAWGMGASGQGFIQATLIEQLPAANPITRITGLISNLQASNGSFQIGSTTINMGNTTSVLPSGTALANDQLVNVWSNAPTSGSVITAGAVRVRTLVGVAGPAQVGGLVSMLSGKGFQVSGIQVDASVPQLASTLQSLAPGEYVVVQGQSDAGTGVLSASAIRTFATHPALVELHGTITGFVSAANFMVRGVPVDASASTVTFTGGNAASLGNGVFVDVLGNVGYQGHGNVVAANSVAVQSSPPDGSTVDYQGTVSSLNTASGSFTLTWQHEGKTSTSQVTLAPNAVFSNGQQAAQLINGASIEIEATRTPSGLTAYSVSFQGVGSSGDGGSAPPLKAQGLIFNLTSTSFQVNALTIQINGVNPKGGSLANGLKVEVAFTQSGNLNLAQEISIDH
jgi:hypothetical protein